MHDKDDEISINEYRLIKETLNESLQLRDQRITDLFIERAERERLQHENFKIMLEQHQKYITSLIISTEKRLIENQINHKTELQNQVNTVRTDLIELNDDVKFHNKLINIGKISIGTLSGVLGFIAAMWKMWPSLNPVMRIILIKMVAT